MLQTSLLLPHDKLIELFSLFKMKETVHTLEEEKKNISNVKRKVEDVVRIGSEIRVLADEIQSLEEELSISGSTKTIDECSREMEQLADKG